MGNGLIKINLRDEIQIEFSGPNPYYNDDIRSLLYSIYHYINRRFNLNATEENLVEKIKERCLELKYRIDQNTKNDEKLNTEYNILQSLLIK